MSARLFQPLKAGALNLEHRVVMAPLTRMRAAQPGNVPQYINEQYYAQRSSPGGLIISEGSQISPSAQGAPATPGIHAEAQIAGWRRVTQAVHAKGGLIVLQLWHVGRASHSSFQPDGLAPHAPSPVALEGSTRAADATSVPFETPREFTLEGIASTIEDFAQATRNARLAGFDGVEIHGANGYLVEQFLQTRTNNRTDRYGGSVENRARFALEVTRAVVDAWSADRVGIRLSPFGIANGSGEADPLPIYTHVIQQLASFHLAYLHLVEPRSSGAGKADVDHAGVPSAAVLFRSLWPGVLIAAGNFQPDTAEHFVAQGNADAIAFGRHFISNADLPHRIRTHAALNPYDRSTFYGGGEAGYTDYPDLGETEASRTPPLAVR